LYDTSLDRDDTYVAGSRHREKANWYVNTDQLLVGNDLAVEKNRKESLYLDLLEQYMQIDRKSLLAHDYINAN